MKLVRYFFVGGFAAAVDLSIFFLAVKGLGLPWFPVAVFSFVVATVANYLLSIHFVFESRVRFRRRHEVMLVFLVSSLALVVNQSLLWAAIEIFKVNLLASKIIATGAVFLFNFGCRHYFIFRPRHDGKALASGS